LFVAQLKTQEWIALAICSRNIGVNFVVPASVEWVNWFK